MLSDVIQILLLEDDDADASYLSKIARMCTKPLMKIFRVGDLKSGIEYLEKQVPDVILLDLSLPDAQDITRFP